MGMRAAPATQVEREEEGSDYADEEESRRRSTRRWRWRRAAGADGKPATAWRHNTERSRHTGLAAVMVIEESLALVVGVFAPGLRQLDPRQLVGDPPVLRPLVVIVWQEPQVDALLKHLGGYLRGVEVGGGRDRIPTPCEYGLAGIAIACHVIDMYIEPSSLELNSTL